MDSIKRNMKSIVSFLGGIVLTLLIVLIFGQGQSLDVVESVSSGSDVKNQIALVNLDTGIEGKDINIADSMITNLYEPDDYYLVSTTYTQAKSGVEGDSYAAYIVFDSEYSNAILSAVSDEVPSKANVQVKLNSHLTESERTEVVNVLLREMYYINNTTNYMYITLLLDTVHSSQEEVESIIGNEEYINGIITSVNEYNENVTKSIENYMSNSEYEEVEIDTSLIDEIKETNIELIEDVYDVSTQELQDKIRQNQSEINAELVSYKNQGNLELDPIDSSAKELDMSLEQIKLDTETEIDTHLLEMINENISYSNEINENIKLVNDKVNDVDEKLNGLAEIEDVEFFNVIETTYEYMADYDITGLDSYLSEYKALQVIHDFQISYDYWVANPDSCSKESIGDPGYSVDTNGCMRPFISKYESEIPNWKTRYEEVKEKYTKIEEYNERAEFIEFKEKINNYVNNLTEEYQTYVGESFESIAQAYSKTAEYCLEADENNVSKLMCNHQNIIDDLVDIYKRNEAILTKYNRKVIINNLHIAVHNANVEKHNTAIEDYNTATQIYILGKNGEIITNNASTIKVIKDSEKAQIEQVQSIEQPINNKIDETINDTNTKIESANTSKDEYAAEKAEETDEFETSINEKIKNQNDMVNERSEGVLSKALSYEEAYPVMSEYLVQNQDYLTVFEELMGNTKNANGANYYIYEYLVNPISITDETGEMIVEETETTQETNNMKYIMIVIGVVLLIIGVGYLFYVGKQDE